MKCSGPPRKATCPLDRFAAGKTADGLVHNRLENGGSQILFGGAFIDQSWISVLAKTPQRAAIG